jgi:hypothetical protein
LAFRLNTPVGAAFRAPGEKKKSAMYCNDLSTHQCSKEVLVDMHVIYVHACHVAIEVRITIEVRCHALKRHLCICMSYSYNDRGAYVHVCHVAIEVRITIEVRCHALKRHLCICTSCSTEVLVYMHVI